MLESPITFNWLRGTTAVVGFAFLAGAHSPGITAAVVVLSYPGFPVSGKGDLALLGSINHNENTLYVSGAPAAIGSWNRDHGIRVAKAGTAGELNVPDGTITCRFDPSNRECEIALGLQQDLHYWAELRFMIRPHSRSLRAGELYFLLEWGNRVPQEWPDHTGLPDETSLIVGDATADVWTESFAKFRGDGDDEKTGLDAIKKLHLVCSEPCSHVKVELKEFELVSDLITKVATIEFRLQGVVFTLEEGAGRSVTDAVVYHDDTAAVRMWLDRADSGVVLRAPPGIYYINRTQQIRSHTTIRCAGARQTVFKNTGQKVSGPKTMFQLRERERSGQITIHNCGFDANGWNASDYMAILRFRGTPKTAIRNIHINGNRFFDSNPPGTEGCDQANANDCATLQRIYIAVREVDTATIVNNRLSGGGRIKAGGPGKNVSILRNRIHFANDNAITVVDTSGSCSPIDIEVDEIEEDQSKCERSDASCTTSNIHIERNIIIDPVGNGIFFGADGSACDHPAMRLSGMWIRGNRISGPFRRGIHGVLPTTTSVVEIIDNEITSRRDTPIPARFNDSSGITLSHGAQKPAGGVVLDSNRVVVSGPLSTVLAGGIVITGAMRGVRVVENRVMCQACRGIGNGGIRFNRGPFREALVRANKVEGARIALLTSEIEDGNFEITQNVLLSSDPGAATPLRGQVDLGLAPGGTIEVNFDSNRIIDGRSAGITCRPLCDKGFEVTFSGRNEIRNALKSIIDGQRSLRADDNCVNEAGQICRP